MAPKSSKVYLPVPYSPKGTKTTLNLNNRAPSPLIVPEIKNQPKSDIDILWDGMKEEKAKLEQQLAREMMEQAVDPELQSLIFESKYDNPGISDLMVPFADSKGYIPNPAKSYKATENFAPSKNPSTTDLFFPQWLSISPSSTLLSSPLSPKRQPYTIGEPMRYPGRSIAYDGPITSTEKNGSLHLKSLKAPLAALAGLTGLGGLTALLRSQDSEEPVTSADTISSYDSPAQVLKANQSLEQQYVTQGLPLSTRPPQSYPVDVADEELVEVPEGLSSSDLRYLTNGTIQRVSQGVNQQVRDYVRPTSTSTSIPASTATSTTTTQRPSVVRKQQPVSTGSSGPRVLNGPRVVSNQSNAPVTGNNLRAETSLARAMVSPPNPDALHRARYQSLMNSGLKGMSPDEAIRSGLLTPEQVQVLMRGPF